MKLIVIVFILLACPLILAAEVRSVQHQNENRLYRLHNKFAALAGPAPVVVVLHGYFNKEVAIRARTTLDPVAWQRIEELAKKENFLVVHPAAYFGQWNLVAGLKNNTFPNGQTIDDVGFIHKVVAGLIEERLADPARVYLAGISDGAIMSYKFICQADTPFAAAVPMIGTMHEQDQKNCANKNPPPMMVIAGTRDRILPYDGWIFRNGREISIPETMNHFRLLQGCKKQKAKRLDDVDKDDNSYIVRITWTECRRDNTVVLLRVTGGGHSLPKREPISENWLKKSGGHNRDIDSAEALWNFVRAHQKL